MAMTRSQMMGRIGPKVTVPEMVLRRALYASGMRFRVHCRDIPGTPDIVMRPHRLVIFVHGCFWHRHPGCRHASTSRTNREFWIRKFDIDRNIERDRRKRDRLIGSGWTVGEVWECELRDKEALALSVEAIRSLRVRSGAGS